MSLPGPGLGPWAIALVALAIGIAIVGEVIRRFVARYAPIARTLRPIERLLVDVYLGGGVLFLLAVVPFELFYSFTPGLVIALAVAIAAGWSWTDRRAHRPMAALRQFLADLRAPMVLVALATGFALGLVELGTATSVPTGNTFDSSMLAYNVAHLTASHTVPFNFLPATAFANPYPEGTTAWLAAYQGTFGLPPARTSLFVTPFFLGLAPLGAFVVGDRLLRSPTAGATFAVIFAFVGSWTRVLVAGSNDFVLAFPLVLLLFARVEEWTGPNLPAWGDAVAYGGLVGVAVSLNPAGPIWLLLTIALGASLARPRWAGKFVAWFGRWLIAAAVGIAFALPSLIEETIGPGGLVHRGQVPGAVAAPGIVGGISGAQFIGLSDPFLFRGTDVWLSPFPLVRDELAVLIALGAAALLLAAWIPEFVDQSRAFRFASLTGGVVALGILGTGVAVPAGAAGLGPFLALTSFAETSILLFAIYTMVAAVPVYLLVRTAGGILRSDEALAALPPVREPRLRSARVGHFRRTGWVGLALITAFLLVAPGVGGTFGALPEYETSLYHAFGNVTQGDLDLLKWAPANLPHGARIVVAPGSAAEFLPGYVPWAVVLFPMIDGVYVNASYQLIVRELTNGTLDSVGIGGLDALSPGYVVVTGANSQLYRPFSPSPFLQLHCGEMFHEGDAYVFGWPPIIETGVVRP